MRLVDIGGSSRWPVDQLNKVGRPTEKANNFVNRTNGLERAYAVKIAENKAKKVRMRQIGWTQYSPDKPEIESPECADQWGRSITSTCMYRGMHQLRGRRLQVEGLLKSTGDGIESNDDYRSDVDNEMKEAATWMAATQRE